jgi:hypothetical protein
MSEGALAMQGREDVSRAEADSQQAHGAARTTERLPPSGADWSIDADPVNPGWRASRGNTARQRIAARRGPRLPKRASEVVPWLQHGGWRWLALVAGALLLLLVALSLLNRGGEAFVADEPTTDLEGAGDTLTVQPTVTGLPALPTAPPPPPAFTVANTDGQGLFLRPEPNSNNTPIKLLADGTRLDALGEEVQGADYVWVKVRDPEGSEGWVALDFVTPAN